MRYPEANGEEVVLQFRDSLLPVQENDRLKKGKFNIEVMRIKFILNIGAGRAVYVKISFKGEKKVVEISNTDQPNEILQIVENTAQIQDYSKKVNNPHRATDMPTSANFNQTNNKQDNKRHQTTVDKELVVSDKKLTTAEKLKVNKTKIIITLPIINISVCDFYDQKRREELLNVTIKDLSLNIASTREFLQMQMKLNKIQIDNNTLVCEYPVVLSNYEFSCDNNIQVNDILAVELKMLQDTITSHMCIDNFEVVMHGFRLDLEEDYFTKLLKLGEKMNKALSLIDTGIVDNRTLIEYRYFRSLSQIDDLSKFRR